VNQNSDHDANVNDFQTDVVVVGGGGAGLAAAVAASERGAKVLVLERRRALGGNSARAGGIFAAESPVQRRLRIDTRRDVCFKMQMEYSRYSINPRIFRAFVDKSGDTVKWLEDQGLKNLQVPPYYPGQIPQTWHTPRHGGADIIRVLVRSCRNLNVRWFTQTRGKKLLMSEKGNIAGVVAIQKRKPITIAAPSAIIATGGYAGNRELLKKYYPVNVDDLYRVGYPHMGDGIRMATEIGGDTEGLGTLHLTGPACGDNRTLTGIAAEPNTVWVNKKGERFIDEVAGLKTFISINAVMRQPDKLTFTLFDNGIKQFLAEKGLTKGVGSIYRMQKIKSANWQKELEVQAEKGVVKISDSWTEIARWIGADPKVLKATIDEYNASCDRGYDPIFAKDRVYLKPLRTPPYYAIKAAPVIITTLGGVKINERMEAIDIQGNPIPGLYATGNETGGWQPETYNIELAGGTFGFAVNSGRIAGEGAAKYVLG
jgi:fumarate reductase flavoprotein subunit